MLKNAILKHFATLWRYANTSDASKFIDGIKDNIDSIVGVSMYLKGNFALV